MLAEAVTSNGFAAWGIERPDPGPNREEENFLGPQRQPRRADKSHLGSGPSHLAYPSKMSPSESKLRFISKANVGTFPCSVPGLFYISPWGFLSWAKSAPLRSLLLSQLTPKASCISLGYMCSAIATVMSKV